MTILMKIKPIFEMYFAFMHMLNKWPVVNLEIGPSELRVQYEHEKQ